MKLTARSRVTHVRLPLPLQSSQPLRTTPGPVNHQDGLPCHKKGGGPRNPWSVSQQDESVCLISVHKRDAVLAEARIGQWIPSRS